MSHTERNAKSSQRMAKSDDGNFERELSQEWLRNYGEKTGKVGFRGPVVCCCCFSLR